MNRAVQPDAGLPADESKTVLPGKDHAVDDGYAFFSRSERACR